MDVGQLFFGFNGRINRARYWIAILVYVAIALILGVFTYMAGHGSAIESASGMIGIVLLISSIAVSIKRLHDRNRSGWFMLLFYLAPAVLLIGGRMFGTGQGEASTAETVLGFVALALLVWAMIELGFRRGTIGNNTYGPDPIAPEILTPPVRIPH
jgi:uncharacterized membrane protein YhaH (DUF805 family)